MIDGGLDPRFASAVVSMVPRAIGIAKSLFSGIDQAVEYEIRQAHYNYACSIVRKYSRSKTFFIRSEPVDLYDFYVPSSVDRAHGAGRVERVDVRKLRAVGKNVIISGSGGSGKTVLMRHLLLNSLLEGDSFPILVELRNLNDDPSKTIEMELHEILRSNGFGLDEKFIRKSLADGLFVLLLDGFDEVQFARRTALQREIQRLSLAYECQIVITSRADSSLQAWDRFVNLHICALNLEEACSLVEKIRFDEDIKSRFVRSLRGGLFESHEFFLSNPLLLSIMLLTYGDSADIPKRQSSFYMQAYEALFQQHDALKSGFRRDRRTDLDIYEFSRLFAGFCVVSYRERAFQFSQTDAVKFARKAGEITGVSRVSYEGFIDDAKQAVCLLIEDGLQLAFVHRSFQEFFVAKFISEADAAVQKKIVEAIVSARSSSLGRDSVIDLLQEISPLVVEKYYLIPKLTAFFGKAGGRRVSKKFWFDKFVGYFDQIRYEHKDKRVWLHVGKPESGGTDMISFVSRAYLGNYAMDQGDWGTKSEAFAEKYFEGKPFTYGTDKLSYSSEMVSDLSEMYALWSPEGFEQVRKAWIDMKERAANRASAIEKAFSL